MSKPETGSRSDFLREPLRPNPLLQIDEKAARRATRGLRRSRSLYAGLNTGVKQKETEKIENTPIVDIMFDVRHHQFGTRDLDPPRYLAGLAIYFRAFKKQYPDIKSEFTEEDMLTFLEHAELPGAIIEGGKKIKGVQYNKDAGWLIARRIHQLPSYEPHLAKQLKRRLGVVEVAFKHDEFQLLRGVVDGHFLHAVMMQRLHSQNSPDTK